MAVKPAPEMLRVELGPDVALGRYLPDGLTEVPAMASFAAVGVPGAPPEPALAWAKLLRRGDEVWAELRWTLEGREHVYRMPDDVLLELAAAGVMKGTGTKCELERVLFVVVRPAAGPRR